MTSHIAGQAAAILADLAIAADGPQFCRAGCQILEEECGLPGAGAVPNWLLKVAARAVATGLRSQRHVRACFRTVRPDRGI